MTQVSSAPADVGGLLRVTVVAGETRRDLALPGQLAVAELLPELSRALNLLDAGSVYAGYTLVTSDGRTMAGDVGLFAQGVDAGSVLTLVAGVDTPAPRVYDDVVEAMADTVESQMRPWDPASGRRTALVTAALVLALGAAALGLQRPDLIAGATAGVAALVLLVAAVVLDRLREEHETAVLLAWAGVVFAAVGGVTAAPAGHLLGVPAAIGAGGALVAGAVGLAGLTERRSHLIPAVIAGAAFVAADGVVAASHFVAASVHVVVLVVVVLAGSVVPWVSLASTGTRPVQAHETADLVGNVTPVDATAVARDARIGHELLVALTVTVSLVLVLVAPLAVARGIPGTLVAVAASAVLLLRTRQYRVGSEVVVGLVGGVAGLVAVGLGVVVEQRSWLPVLAVVLAVVAVALLVSTLVPRPASVRWGRLGDVAEALALVAMLPLTVFAIGLVG